MRVLLLLAVIALPVCAEELQFDLSGQASRGLPFEVSFTLDTLSGPSAFRFAPGGCLADWSFSGANVTNLLATIGGEVVVNEASTVASGNGSLDAPDRCNVQKGEIFMTDFLWQDMRTSPTPALGTKDPLAVFLSQPLQGGYGELPGSELEIESVQVTPVGVTEPGLLALLLLGLTATQLSRKPLGQRQ